MLFLLVAPQLETWKQTAALKQDLCLFPVQAADGPPGPASPGAVGKGQGAWLPGGLWGPGARGRGWEGRGRGTVLRTGHGLRLYQMCF